MKADVYLAGKDPLHAWGLDHRRRISIEGLDDIAGVLDVQGPAIDRARIEGEVATRGLAAEWAEALRRTTSS